MMLDWKRKALKKRNGSQTPGKTKGENCKATPLDKWMATHSRSYKHTLYSAWCNRKKG